MGNKYTAEIGAKDAGYTSTMKQINKSTESIGGTMKSVSSSVNASFASMVKAGAAMAVGFGAVKLAINAVKGVVSEFGDAINLGGQLNDLSSRTGETAGNLLILQRSFENAGVSADKVGPAVNKLQKFMDDAGQGTKLNIETLQRLGLTYDELKGKTPTEQMEIFANRITAIQDPTERAGLAMKVFGKSGAELLPLLTSFSSEVDRAKSQLGELPNVMDRSNVAFDRISDNLGVIKTKVRDFAAGFLDRLLPAIEFATEMLTRFDAAALGMKFGDVIAGAGNGISAFTDALKALSMGDFTLSWQIAFNAFKLSAAESFNSIYKNIVASMSAAVAFIKEVFGPTSGIFNAISLGFDIIGLKLQKSISSAFIGIVKEIPVYGGEMARSIAESMQKAESDINLSIWAIKQSMGEIPNDFAQGVEKAKDSFDKNLATAKDLINTTKIQTELDKERAALQEKIVESQKNQGLASEKYDSKRLVLQEQYQRTLEVIAKLEDEIKEAKMLGDTAKAKELERQLALEKLIAEEIKNGKTYQEAMAIATEKQNNADANVLANKKEQTAELQKQLSLSEDMLETIERMKQEKAIDPSGRLQEKFNEAINKGDVSGAERIQRQIENRESKKAVQDAFKDFIGEKDRKAGFSLADMAEKLGIETFGKDSKKLREEVAAELKKRKGEEEQKAKKEAPATPKEEKQEQRQEQLGGVVGEILGVCREIAGKLPQQALSF